MEEAPSSMVSSEAESEGSIVSEARHDTEQAAAQSDASTEHTHTQHERALPAVSSDWRTVGTSVTTFVSTRGMTNFVIMPLCIFLFTFLITETDSKLVGNISTGLFYFAKSLACPMVDVISRSDPIALELAIR